MADHIIDRTIDVELPSEDRSVVREAIGTVVADDWQAGKATLRTRYESICETDHPTGDRATCHLLDGE